MTRDLRFEAHYRHPPERVWDAITDSAQLARWLMPNDFRPELGHRFRFRAPPQPGWDGIVDCEVTRLEPPRALAFTWQNKLIDTVVTFTLEPEGDGTHLVLEHTGFRGWKGFMVSFILGSGWKGIVNKHLPAVLDGSDVERDCVS